MDKVVLCAHYTSVILLVITLNEFSLNSLHIKKIFNLSEFDRMTFAFKIDE